MPNVYLTAQVWGEMFAEDVKRLIPDVKRLIPDASPELLDAAKRCATDCGRIMGPMEADDPRARLRSTDGEHS